MSQPGDSYSLEGELVRDVWDYEFDDLMIDGRDLASWITSSVGPGRQEDETRTTRKTHYGRVRLTLEVLDLDKADSS